MDPGHRLTLETGYEANWLSVWSAHKVIRLGSEWNQWITVDQWRLWSEMGTKQIPWWTAAGACAQTQLFILFASKQNLPGMLPILRQLNGAWRPKTLWEEEYVAESSVLTWTIYPTHPTYLLNFLLICTFCSCTLRWWWQHCLWAVFIRAWPEGGVKDRCTRFDVCFGCLKLSKWIARAHASVWTWREHHHWLLWIMQGPPAKCLSWTFWILQCKRL